MGDVYLATESDKIAVIERKTDSGEPVRVATVYLMADGWHAWSGPFGSPAEALASFDMPISA
jgi:hypothetical protein